MIRQTANPHTELARQAQRQVDVQQAARMLDHELPGWAVRIDIGRLDLDDPRCCLLGQLFGEPSWGWKLRHWRLARHAHGFTRGLLSLPWRAWGVTPGVVSDAARYQDAWVAAIADRVVARRGPQTP